MASPKDHHDADHEDAVCLVRRIAKTYLGGNATFVDSDIRLLGILAQRAVLAGLTDDVRDGRTIRNMSRAAEAARADHESALGRSFSSGLTAFPKEQAPLSEPEGEPFRSMDDTFDDMSDENAALQQRIERLETAAKAAVDGWLKGDDVAGPILVLRDLLKVE